MPATLTTRRFTVDEYDRMIEAGILQSGERVELIEGEIVRMAAIGSRHAACVMRLNRVISSALGGRALIAVQSPIRLGEFSEPEPDLAILRARHDDYASGHPRPTEVFLVIEVADTTLDKDREIKGPLYAAAAIAEYWLVDLARKAIEMFREPVGGAYRNVERHGRGDVLRPLAFPELDVPVDAVLP